MFLDSLRPLFGLALILVVAYFLSDNRKAISWPLVVSAMLMQLVFAAMVLHVAWFQSFIEFISSFFVVVLQFTKQGSEFVFGDLVNTQKTGYIFAFQVLPTIIFFSALTSVLFYYGVLQRVVGAMSWALSKLFKLSGAENLSTTANIFLGQTEAPILIKPYLPQMNRSEIFCVMVGGMANTAGGVLAAYVGFLGGADPAQQLYFAKHLLAASLMSAPAAILVSKMLVPQVEKIEQKFSIPKDKFGDSALEAIANGTTEGLKLAVNVGAMLIVFIALIAMGNFIMGEVIGASLGLNEWVTSYTNGQYKTFSLQFVLGLVGAPLVWLLGIPSNDKLLVGQLLGEKTILNEFVAYANLAKMKDAGVIADSRSVLLATYMLSGFANFSSIGIQIGGIGALAPSKRSQLASLGIKALIGGTLATLIMTGIVSLIIGF